MSLKRDRLAGISRRPIAELALLLGIMLIPYDALRLMPSEYRPVSVYLLIVALFFALGSREVSLISKGRLLLFLFVTVAIITTSLIALQTKYDTARVPSFILTLLIGALLFAAFSMLFEFEMKDRGIGSFSDWCFTWLSRAYVLPVIVGVLEALSLQGLIPLTISTNLSRLFGSLQEGRLTLTTYEASWASFHLLIASIAYFYRFRMTRSLFSGTFLVIAVALFLYTQSMQGIMVVTIAAFVYVIWISYKRGNLLTLIKWVALILLAVLALFLLLKIIYSSQERDTYYSRRLLGFEGLGSLIKNDGSSFVRIMFPVMGLQMFIDHPFVGIGGGMFASHMPSYVLSYYPWAVSFGEIAEELAGKLVPSAVCLYTRVFAEQGIVGAVLFFGFLLHTFRGFAALSNVADWRCRTTAFFLILLICMPFQFASYAFLPLWLSLGFLEALINSLAINERQLPSPLKK